MSNRSSHPLALQRHVLDESAGEMPNEMPVLCDGYRLVPGKAFVRLLRYFALH
jgi:hypothetical protein